VCRGVPNYLCSYDDYPTKWKEQHFSDTTVTTSAICWIMTYFYWSILLPLRTMNGKSLQLHQSDDGRIESGGSPNKASNRIEFRIRRSFIEENRRVIKPSLNQWPKLL